MSDKKFIEATKDMSSAEILNYYRNLYYNDGNATEKGIVANAINDVFSTTMIPCQIGTILYWPLSHLNVIDECKVSSLTLKADGTWKIRLTSTHYRCVFEIVASDVGDKVYRSRHEAEKDMEKAHKCRNIL